MRNQFLAAAIFSFFTAFSIQSYAQDGSFDTGFGSAGILTVTSGVSDNLNSVLVQSDGKVVLGGVSRTGSPVMDRFYVNRILSNGLQDGSFNGGVAKVIDDSSSSFGAYVAQAADGGIFYAGSRGQNILTTLGKLNPDGSDAFLPVGPYSSTPGNYIHNVPCMSYNKINNKIAVGGYVTLTNYYMFAYRFKGDGTLDNSFNGSGIKYFGGPPTPTTAQTYVYAKAVLNLDDGSTLLACNLAYGGNFTVVKLKPDGSLDNTFGLNGVSQVSIDPSYGGPEGMLLLPDGKIMVCGGSQIGLGRYTIIRLNANGSQDTQFNAVQIGSSGSNNYFTSMTVQPDKKILVTGISSAIVGGTVQSVVMRYNEDGSVDTNFGLNGTVTLYGIQLKASAISTTEKRAFFVGKNSSNQMTVVKLIYETQPFNILGKDIVAVETENNFQIHPVVSGNTYVWSFGGINYYTLGTNTSDVFTVYFKRSATSGTLSCSIYNPAGALIKKVDKAISINPEPSLSELLEPVQCGATQSYSAVNYINSFSINQTKLKSANTGASASGYNDLTASGNYDTLYLGDNYQASLECINTNNELIYCGVWIDLNNDGKMESANEFVGSAASDTKVFTVNNIVVPADAEAGPKRVRVRVRQTTPFVAGDCCIPNEEISETEDYLVVLGDYTGIKVPNFITPNNDGKNDNFVVRGVKADLKNSLKVFNRIGDLVYDQENYDNNWGGSDKSGGKLKPGTYYFVFSQTNPDKGNDDIVKGFFEIRY